MGDFPANCGGARTNGGDGADAGAVGCNEGGPAVGESDDGGGVRAVAGQGGEREGEVRTRGSDGANGVESAKVADVWGCGRGGASAGGDGSSLAEVLTQRRGGAEGFGRLWLVDWKRLRLGFEHREEQFVHSGVVG